MSRRGRFITLEGGDGCGKSTQAAALHELMVEYDYPVRVTAEPAGTDFGREVWRFFTGEVASGSHLAPTAELFLFEADRAQHVSEVVQPALEAGTHVICSRFVDSTIAYQGYGRGLNHDQLRAVNHVATGGLLPDLTLLLDVPVDIGLARKRGEATPDRIGREERDFHERVRQGFLELAAKEPRRFVVIDASQLESRVTDLCWDAVRHALDLLD